MGFFEILKESDVRADPTAFFDFILFLGAFFGPLLKNLIDEHVSRVSVKVVHFVPRGGVNMDAGSGDS